MKTMYSDSDYVTTYSADERIAECLNKERKIQEDANKKYDLTREQEFIKYYNSMKSVRDSIFNLDGIKFLKYCHKKIKFLFQPYKVALVSKKVIFYCSLKYRNKHWILKRDSFPVNYKERIRNIFYNGPAFAINDHYIQEVLRHIHEILIEWSMEHEAYRAEKFMAFRNGSDIILDSDDEELFLEKEEIEEIHIKRNLILQRMKL